MIQKHHKQEEAELLAYDFNQCFTGFYKRTSALRYLFPSTSVR